VYFDWYAPILGHLVATLWAAWERSPYLQHYQSMRRTQYDAPAVIRDRQWQTVSVMLHMRTTPSRSGATS
jgi:hypothetical protein